jgi:mevalonate kinase
MTHASAPGKCILFGEHAVVYGRPAIAVPLLQLRARVEIETTSPPDSRGIRLLAPDVKVDAWLYELSPDDPLRRIVDLTLSAANAERASLRIQVHSDIPIAAGMGSGAAVSVALSRALSLHLGTPLPEPQISNLAFEVERLHHGTPSGIDNTVITYEKGVFFTQDGGAEPFSIRGNLQLAIADTGVASPTRDAVGMVREAWQRDPTTYEGIFDQIGAIARAARQSMIEGEASNLGSLMDENQTLLERLHVSTDALRRLMVAARDAGALGAKLSGAGLGGIMIALCPAGLGERIRSALGAAGAAWTYLVEVEG